MLPLDCLLAVHISSGVLAWPWLILGGAAMVALLAWSTWEMHDEEIPRTALIAAVFFVAGLIHVRVGPTSVHLLLNGLVGILIGRRSAAAIGCGVVLQAFLLGHGDVSTIGINGIVLALPAFLANPVYRFLRRAPRLGLAEASLAVSFVLFPWSVLLAGPVVFALRRLDRRWRISGEFRTGFLIGALTVMATVTLNGLVLIGAGVSDWRLWAAAVWLAHLPVAVVEGVIVGFLLNFLRKVAPHILPLAISEEPPIESEFQLSGKSSSSGTSH